MQQQSKEENALYRKLDANSLGEMLRIRTHRSSLSQKLNENSSASRSVILFLQQRKLNL